MSAVNQSLMGLIENFVDEGQRQQLYEALIAREDHALDHLRVAAAGQGLMPSITAIILLRTGLGSPVDPTAYTLLLRQAERETQELNEAIRRAQEE